jgi:serine/threonine-protein kinase HipA
MSAPWYVNCHSLTINDKNRDVELKDMLEVARKFNIKSANALIDRAIEVVDNFEGYAQQAGLDRAWISKIKEDIKERSKKL